MYGKSYYNIWLKKHGKEEADKKQEIVNEKISLYWDNKRNKRNK